MNKVAGILFDGNNKVVFYNTNGLDLNEKDFVVLETERGIELGNLISFFIVGIMYKWYNLCIGYDDFIILKMEDN